MRRTICAIVNCGKKELIIIEVHLDVNSIQIMGCYLNIFESIKKKWRSTSNEEIVDIKDRLTFYEVCKNVNRS